MKINPLMIVAYALIVLLYAIALLLPDNTNPNNLIMVLLAGQFILISFAFFKDR